MRTHQLLQLLTVLVLWAGAAWGEEQPRSYEDLIALSKCSPKCFEFGSCNEELGRCDCIKGRQGPDCSEALPPDQLDAMCKEQFYPNVRECLKYGQPCLNACNGRGTCMLGVCKCRPGTFGADCALSIGSDGKPVLLSDQGYMPRAKRPLIYVYELPPEFSSWGNTRRMDRPLHILFTQRLLSSGARTADPAQADWFFIPMRLRSHRDSGLFVRAVDYISKTWPWLKALEGRKHIVMHTGDLGLQEINAEAKGLVPNATWLTHWGLHDDNDVSSWRAAHRPAKDIVIPVYISPHHFPKFGMDESPLHPKSTTAPVRRRTFFFAGRICGDRSEPRQDGVWPNCGERSSGYSAGVRQRVHYYHHNRTGYMIVTRVGGYDKHLLHSRFCLAPTGGGHGQRQILVSFMGCIPVTIGNDIYQPFEPELDWSRFAVQPVESQIPVLHQLLDAVSEEELGKMQASLKCAAQHFVWSSVTGGFMGETGQFDAFETTLEILRVKAQYPDAAPFEYGDLDRDFRLFMQCGAEDMGGPVNTTWLSSRGSAFVAAATQMNPLCSHSRFDGHEPPCERCTRGSSNTHGVPGGFMCCGLPPDKLGSCPRVWD